MPGAEILTILSQLGFAGVLLYFMLINNKEREARDKLYLDRLDRIENRHIDEEKSGREQVRVMFEQVRSLFDRVITICNDLSVAVKELRETMRANEKTMKSLELATKAHEKAIQELRDEIHNSGNSGQFPRQK